MSENSNNAPEIPEVENSGSSGEQTKGMTGEVLRPITQTSFPAGEFLGAMTELAESRQRGFSGSGEATLILARFSEFLSENNDLKQNIEALQKSKEDQQATISRLNVENQKLTGEVASLRRSNWLPTILSVVGGVLISVAFLPGIDSLNDRDWSILVLGFFVFGGAIVAQFIGSKGDK